MRSSVVVFIFGLLLATQATAQKLPRELTGKIYDVWDCKLGRTHPAKRSSHLNVGQVHELAVAFAKREGVDLAQYAQVTVCFDANKAKPAWIVYFDRVVPAPGSLLVIRIGDRDQAADLYWGR